MNIDGKTVGIGALVLALAAGGIWWWQGNREKVWRAEPRRSPVAAAEPFLAATWLLSQNGYRVESAKALEHLNLERLRDGTLLLGGSEGVMSPAQGGALLAWVARGNTLIFQPRDATKAELQLAKNLAAAAAAAPKTEVEAEAAEDASVDAAASDAEADAEAADEASVKTVAVEGEHDHDHDDAPLTKTDPDPLGEAIAVRWTFKYVKGGCSTLTTVTAAQGKDCPPGTVRAASLRTVQLPGRAPAVIEVQGGASVLLVNSPAPLWTDSQGTGVRAYRHGKGHLVVAPASMFRNSELRSNDHGALLLGLAAMNGAHKQVTIVTSRKILDWMELLWINYKMMLVALAALLALLFWAAVRRFGPVLPDAEPQRRSLMEHIDASGAWLWKAEGGRQVLLQAARTELEQTLQRRAPALLRLGQNSQHEELGRLCGLPAFEVAHAMHDDAASQSLDFTRQIRTLQTLRKHYER